MEHDKLLEEPMLRTFQSLTEMKYSKRCKYFLVSSTLSIFLRKPRGQILSTTGELFLYSWCFITAESNLYRVLWHSLIQQGKQSTAVISIPSLRQHFTVEGKQLTSRASLSVVTQYALTRWHDLCTCVQDVLQASMEKMVERWNVILNPILQKRFQKLHSTLVKYTTTELIHDKKYTLSCTNLIC